MKTLLFSLLMLCGAGISNGTVSSPNPGGISVLTINAASSTIDWKAEKTTGKHNGTIKIRSGSLTLRCAQLASGSVFIDMNSINVADLSGPDKGKLENNLKGDNFFDTGKFPLAKLDIISVNYKSVPVHHFITILGNLNLHGVTKQVIFTADVSKSTYDDFTAQADMIINRRDFGIATSNIKYDTFIDKSIHLHILLQASKVKEQVTSL
ncbi:MAG TPA: YceI family protein [Mucilaginibacter sp.]|nr:YceI family protein [Mucilaginibacter sp.]